MLRLTGTVRALKTHVRLLPDFDANPHPQSLPLTQELAIREMSPSCESLRDQFFLPDNRSIGATKVAAERQGKSHPTHIYSS